MWWGSVYLAAAHAPPSTIYVVTSSNAVVNLSTGTVGYPLHAIGALAIDPHDPATVYVGTGNWVYKSTDAGFRWYQTSPQKNCLGDADCLVTALAIDAAGSEILYAGTSDGRVHKSTDGGVSWAAIGLTPPPVDTEAPDTTITSALDNRGNEIWNGGSTRSDMITFKFAGSDNNGITGFECSVDAAAFASCPSPRILNGISRGSHSFRVRAVDSRGFRDQSPGAFSWSRQ